MHEATLVSGQRVAVKILRPHIAEAIETDLAALKAIFGMAQYIEGEPAVNISEIPLDPDLTNAAKRKNEAKKGNAEKIKGLRNEDSSPTEGKFIFCRMLSNHDKDS